MLGKRSRTPSLKALMSIDSAMEWEDLAKGCGSKKRKDGAKRRRVVTHECEPVPPKLMDKLWLYEERTFHISKHAELRVAAPCSKPVKKLAAVSVAATPVCAVKAVEKKKMVGLPMLQSARGGATTLADIDAGPLLDIFCQLDDFRDIWLVVTMFRMFCPALFDARFATQPKTAAGTQLEDTWDPWDEFASCFFYDLCEPMCVDCTAPKNGRADCKIEWLATLSFSALHYRSPWIQAQRLFPFDHTPEGMLSCARCKYKAFHGCQPRMLLSRLCHAVSWRYEGDGMLWLEDVNYEQVATYVAELYSPEIGRKMQACALRAWKYYLNATPFDLVPSNEKLYLSPILLCDDCFDACQIPFMSKRASTLEPLWEHPGALAHMSKPPPCDYMTRCAFCCEILNNSDGMVYHHIAVDLGYIRLLGNSLAGALLWANHTTNLQCLYSRLFLLPAVARISSILPLIPDRDAHYVAQLS